MNTAAISEYNRDQLRSLEAIRDTCRRLPESEIHSLIESLQPYLEFRQQSERYQARYFRDICSGSCFSTGLSACCGFESIITFFADHVINFLLSTAEETGRLFSVLGQPNRTGRCVYLHPTGCLWRLTPISCAMFLCDDAKHAAFGRCPDAAPPWVELREREKDYTCPTKPVIFDDLEKVFRALAVDSPHMYFHTSPGLLRLKARAGILEKSSDSCQ
jgi:hypothetical protein